MSGHCLDAHHRGLKRRRQKNDIQSPIKTVVVVVMENRGIFDHVLGWLPRTRLDIDGLTGCEYNCLNASDPSSPRSSSPTRPATSTPTLTMTSRTSGSRSSAPPTPPLC
jgi:phospholipase C